MENSLGGFVFRPNNHWLQHLCNYISFWLVEGQETRVGVFCVVTKRPPPPRYTQSPTTLTWSAVFLEPGWHLVFGDSTYSILVNFLWLYVCKKYPFQLFVCVLFFDSPPVTAILLIGWPSQLQFRSNMKMNLKANRPSQSTTHYTYAQLCRKAWDSHGEIVMHH